MTKSRLEAFSDGVLAVAITLLVLDLHGPTAGQSVLSTLHNQDYELGAYALSFLMVGVMWLNHHTVFRVVDKPDRYVTLANLVLLMMVTLTPWAASVFASGLKDGSTDAKQAAAVYSVVFLLSGLSFTGLWFTITRPGSTVLREDIDPILARKGIWRFGAGNVVYAALILVSFLSPIATLILHALVAFYYVFDQLPVNSFQRVGAAADTAAD